MEFEEFVRDRLPDLVRFTAAMCADRSLAEDVVQNVLIRIYPKWPTVSALDVPEAYVRRALVREYLSWRRKWGRFVPHAAIQGIALDRPVEDHVDRSAQRSELAQQLAALPPRQRTVLVMQYYGGWSDREIAVAIGCRPSTVRAYASRGLAALRVSLGSADRPSMGRIHAD